MTTTDNQTPPWPNEPVVDKTGRVNKSWFYFFLQLFKKTQTSDADSVLLASGAYDAPKDYSKRIHAIEQGLSAIEQPRDFGREIAELRKRIEAIPNEKDYSKDIDALTKKVISEVFEPSKKWQPLDSTLSSISLLGTAADKMIFTTGIDVWAEAALTAAGRAILDDANAAAQATTLGLGTLDTPTFAGLNLGTGELTVGSINRVAGVLTLEIGGTSIVSVAAASVTVAQDILMADGKYIGQVAGPQIAFDDTLNYLEISGCKVGVGTPTPVGGFDVVVNSTGVIDYFKQQNANGYGVVINAGGTAAGRYALMIRNGADDVDYFGILSETGKEGQTYIKGNVLIGTTAPPATMLPGLSLGAGTAPTAVLVNGIGAWVEDITGVGGKAGLHMMAESGTGKLVVAGVLTKTDTGDPAQVHEGLFVINTFDNNVKLYADAAWRQLATW